jgi:hypothetical protein
LILNSSEMPGLSRLLRKMVSFWGMLCLTVPGCCTSKLSLRDAGVPANQILVTTTTRFSVEYRKQDSGWVKDLISRVDAARRTISRATDDAFLVPISVIYAPDHVSFVKLAGSWAENSMAVAVPGTNEIVINSDAVRKAQSDVMEPVLVHEFAHLYLGLRCKRPLPRWLNEGIAMIIAGEWTMDDSAGVVLAAIAHRLIPLRDIESTFPVQQDRQRLAYRESYSAATFIIKGNSGGSLPLFLQQIRGEEGSTRILDFFNPIHRDAIESAWSSSLRSHSNWVLLAFSSGVIWTLITLLAVIAWLIRKWRARRMAQEWEDDDDEEIYAALDEEERRIWGDDADFVDPEDEE